MVRNITHASSPPRPDVALAHDGTELLDRSDLVKAYGYRALFWSRGRLTVQLRLCDEGGWADGQFVVLVAQPLQQRSSPVLAVKNGVTYVYRLDPPPHTFHTPFRIHDAWTSSVTNQSIHRVVFRCLSQSSHLLARCYMVCTYQCIPDT